MTASSRDDQTFSCHRLTLSQTTVVLRPSSRLAASIKTANSCLRTTTGTGWEKAARSFTVSDLSFPLPDHRSCNVCTIQNLPNNRLHRAGSRLRVQWFLVPCILRNHMVRFGARCLQLVGALRYKPEGRGFDPRRCHWTFFLGIILPPH